MGNIAGVRRVVRGKTSVFNRPGLPIESDDACFPEPAMKIMIVWRTVPGKYNTALEAFLRGGGPVPAGVGQHVAEWADLLECEVYPVLDDAGAADAARRAAGSW